MSVANAWTFSFDMGGSPMRYGAVSPMCKDIVAEELGLLGFESLAFVQSIDGGVVEVCLVSSCVFVFCIVVGFGYCGNLLIWSLIVWKSCLCFATAFLSVT